ncbi:MAG TPA: hypothetical protein VKU40_14635 [Thermoanaerobaculia bacterium]|nr:hypothetical protein [Thermoanaerobaculia bacterium]
MSKDDMSKDGLRIGRVVVDEAGGRRVAIEVSPDSPWFEGHFPGHPVLPAMAQIGLVARLAPKGAIASLDGLRLAQAVHPGDLLTLTLVTAAGDEERGRFSLSRDGDGAAVSSGTAAWGGGGKVDEGDETLFPDRGDTPDPAAVLPHQPPARLAETVLRIGDGGIVCRGRVPQGHPSVQGGAAGSWMALELAAQAAGVYQASLAARENPGAADPQVGYIVRMRDVRFARPTLPAGKPLEATVRPEGGGGPFNLFRIRVDLAGDTVATAVIGTFVPATN